MDISREELRTIVEASAFLYERMRPEFGAAAQPGSNGAGRSEEAVRNRIERWRKLVAPDDPRGLEKRLAWDGLDLEKARAFAAGASLCETAELPCWTQTLRRVLEKFAGLKDFEVPPAEWVFLSGAAYPFQELIAPFVAEATERVIVVSGRSFQRLNSAALCRLQQHLLRGLSRISAETLAPDFEIYLTVRRVFHGGSSWAGQSFGAPGTAGYQGFIRQMASGGWPDFLKHQPVLARMLCCIADQWVRSTSEFLLRAETDACDLARHFGQAGDPGQIVEVEPGLSDRHDGGQYSILLKFASGLRVVYKPKPMDVEAEWYRLLEWLNERKIALPLRVFRTVPRDGYGWAEFVDHLPCAANDEVERFYRRAGMLLALLLTLEGSDCHHENLIAHGEHAVLIDMETLFTPRVRNVSDQGTETAARRAGRIFYWDSVFRTALLPRWDFGPEGKSVDISGLGGTDGQETAGQEIVWQDINTDNMRIGRTPARTAERKNAVRVEGRRADPARYVEQIVEGFQTMYGFLRQHAEELIAPDGPLAGFRDAPLRFIFRNTRIYATLLHGFFRPANLTDGMDASIHFDRLSRPLLFGESRHPFWDLIEAEHKALGAGDVPLFTARASSADLELYDGRRIENFFEQPGMDLVADRLQSLSDEDMRMQASFIRASFPAVSRSERPIAGAEEPTLSSGQRCAKSFKREAIGEAIHIAEQIRDAAITSDDGAAWISTAYYPDAQRWQLQPMGPRFYDGECGVALFLAAVESITGGAGFRSLAVSALRTITTFVDEPSFHRWLFELGIGAGTGGASVIYALARCAEFLGEEPLLATAKKSAELLTPERIDNDRKFDVMGGSAGAILSLLALHRIAGWDRALEKASLCGAHLLRHRKAGNGGLRSWPTIDAELQPGFSHGAAGIAYALLRLSAATGNPDFRDAAAEAIAWENGLFMSDLGTWPDFPGIRNKKPRGVEFCAWCHGAPGIGMGRIGGLDVLDNAAIRHDIDAALRTTAADQFSDIDHPCCGNFGKVETLLLAGRLLGISEYETNAITLASRVIDRARNAGRYALGWDSGIFIPAFHQGMSGIGYQLLRLAAPEQIPCALLWL